MFPATSFATALIVKLELVDKLIRAGTSSTTEAMAPRTTLTVAESTFPSTLSTIVLLPIAPAATTPAESTAATDEEVELHWTWEAPSLALSISIPPGSNARNESFAE
jgi:hypothetical protein